MSLLHIATKDVFARELLETGKLALVDFWAPWCGPCKMLGPVIEELAETIDYAAIAKVNVDEAGELASEYGVMSIPTIVFLKDGKEVQRLVGLRGKAELVKVLEELK